MLRFETVHVVMFGYEGVPLAPYNAARFYGRTRPEAEAWIDKAPQPQLYHIEEWTVLTDGERFVPVEARGYGEVE